MPLLTASQLAAIQRLGEQSFTVTVEIYKRQTYAADSSNPFGDDTVTFAGSPITVTGWLVPTDSTDFGIDAAQAVSAANLVVRVPVTTDIEPGDRCVISSNTYYVSESTTEQSTPEWTIARLRRVQ